MASISPTSRPGYVYDSATDTWIPIGIGPHTHQATDLSGVVDDALIDAKGDLIVGSAADTPARLAVGNNGESLVVDSSTSTGLRWQGDYAAGKNKIINGDFGVWQRGTSFSSDGYTSDRWRFSKNASTTASISRQSFTLGSAPVSGYEGTFFARYQRTAGAFDDYFLQRVEDARTFANTTTKLSFWAKASANTTISQIYAAQTTNGSGGGASGNFGGVAITTSWVRYTVDIALPSLSGASLGANNYVEVVFKFGSEMGNITVDLWGVQWEAGSVATAFQTATGTIQGELAACQRYYYRTGTGAFYTHYGMGVGRTATLAAIQIKFPVTMRTIPSSTIDGIGTPANFALFDGTANYALSSITADIPNVDMYSVNAITVSSVLTATRPYQLINNNVSTASIGFSAEL